MKFRFTKPAKEWSKSVREGGKCEICGADGTLNAHHILDRVNYPQFRFETQNGLALCVKCHKFGKFSAHRNPVFFSEWLKANKPAQFAWIIQNLGVLIK